MTINPSNSQILLLTDQTFANAASLDLKLAGYFVVVAKVQQGWEKLSRHQPAMIILDRAITGKQGFNLCRHLRN